MQQLFTTTPNLAFGTNAAQWAARLPAATPLVTCELGTVPFAFVEAARRCKHGEPFGASVFIDDPRAHCALFVAAPPVLAQITDYDERARLLDFIANGALQIGGREQRDIERIDPHFRRCAGEFLATADVVVTRSSVERERLCGLLGRRFTRVADCAPPDPLVPPPEDALAAPAFKPSDPLASSVALRGSAPSSPVSLLSAAAAANDVQRASCGERAPIVVWAPWYPAEACGLFAFALEEFRRPAVIVCAGGNPAPMRESTRFVGIADAAAILAGAAVIIDASISDPGSARALARWGRPLAAAACSGAGDWLDGVTLFDPWNHLSISAAVATTLGEPRARERHPRQAYDTEFLRALAHATPQPDRDGPLVSVVVPTLNSRASLTDALASIAAQTYDNIELVLVNDGGPPFDPALYAAFTHVRIVMQPDRCGVASALNAGIAASRGTYIAALADDDLYCPNHLALVVGKLERTGASVAHAIELREHFERMPDDTYAVIGHTIMVGVPARPSGLQLSNVIGGPSVVFRRDAWDRVGTFDDAAGCVSDLEMWMQLSERFDFVHVDRVTAIMSARTDGSQLSAVSGQQTAEYYRYAYRLHPTTRPLLAAAREQWLSRLETLTPTNLPHIKISTLLTGVSPAR